MPMWHPVGFFCSFVCLLCTLGDISQFTPYLAVANSIVFISIANPILYHALADKLLPIATCS
jgi:hypothetical protein